MTEKDFHPVANIFPLMSGDELQALVDDISLHGLQEPIWRHEGKIIDGRNRFIACLKAGVSPKYRDWDGKGSLVEFVVSLNLHRRHLSSGQRAAAGTEIEELLAKEAKARQRASGGDKKSVAAKLAQKSVEQIVAQPIRAPQPREQAAKIVGSNKKYITDAKKVREASPATFAKVKSGELTLPQAKRAVDRDEKRQALAIKAAAAPAPKEGIWRIIEGDCVTELKKLAAGTARLIFADPPYNIGRDYHGQGPEADLKADKDYLGFCREWMTECGRLLTPDGSLWVMIGDEYADYFGVMLREIGLHRRSWIKWYESFGVNCSNNFNRCSRHIFYCVKDAKRFVFNADPVSRRSDREIKYKDVRADPGGKIWDNIWGINPPLPRLVGTAAEKIPGFDNQLPLALLTPLIGCASDPGDLVIDPFNGTGSTGAAAIALGRRYLGIEKNANACEVTRQRLTVAGAQEAA